MRALAKIYKCQTISEPWTENREKGKLPLNFYLPEKVIVKSMATQYPLDYSIKTPNGTIPSKNSITAHLSIIKKFDKIILIGRKKRKEQIESLSHAIRNFKTPDEFYFIDLINKNNLRNKFKIYDIPLTFVNWKDLSSNPKYRISPKTYDNQKPKHIY